MAFSKLNGVKTIEAMFGIYCGGLHKKGERARGKPSILCQDCRSLLGYAIERLEKCPHGERKPVCSVCKIQCYKPEMRMRISEVMRYAGPRMLLRHPILAGRHLIQKIMNNEE